jgi:ABC-type multidrug transport system fused ATPase/permease subunit
MNGTVLLKAFPTDALRGAYNIFWGDMKRVYRLVSPRLRFHIWLLFFSMLFTALLEVFAITTLAFLGMSVAAPQATAAHPVFSRIHSLFPGISELYADPMLFVLLVSVGVWAVFALKNVAQACVMWRVSRLGEFISLELGEQMLRRYLYSPYIWHLSSDSARTATALGGRESLSSLLIQILNTHVYAITALALFVTLLSATPGAILGVVLATTTLATIIYSVLKRRMDKAGHLVLESAQGQNKSMLSAINGIRDVLIYRQQEVFLRAYAQACRQGSVSRSVVAVTPPMPGWILEALGIGLIPLSIWLLMRQGNDDLGRVAAIISLVMLTAWRILPMVNRALSALITIRGIRPQRHELHRSV